MSDEDIARINEVTAHAWAPKTAETYGSGLLAYHVMCDLKRIPEAERAPASTLLILSFIACLAGSYAGSTISNYFFGIRAWHILHGVPWLINKMETEALLRAAGNVEPKSSKKKKRRPYTVDYICALREHLDMNVSLDAAVWACLTTAFYSVARVGELTLPTLSSFNPASHVKLSDVRQVRDRNNLEETVFFIPKTKSAPEGEDIFWATQLGPSDPTAAFANHLRINNPPLDAPLFSHSVKGNRRPLTKSAFLSRISRASRAAGIDPLQGHGIRIGGTLEYLLRGVPFDVVKSKGSWASEAFTVYLRKHAQVMAPYMQAVPAVHDSFIRYTMPPVR